MRASATAHQIILRSVIHLNLVKSYPIRYKIYGYSTPEYSEKWNTLLTQQVFFYKTRSDWWNVRPGQFPPRRCEMTDGLLLWLTCICMPDKLDPDIVLAAKNKMVIKTRFPPFTFFGLLVCQTNWTQGYVLAAKNKMAIETRFPTFTFFDLQQLNARGTWPDVCTCCKEENDHQDQVPHFTFSGLPVCQTNWTQRYVLAAKNKMAVKTRFSF